MCQESDSARKYYVERKGIIDPKIDFISLKKTFLLMYNQFHKDGYFDEARVIWGEDISLFIFRKLKMWDIWPIEENIDNYDENMLFTVIEFLYTYVSARYFEGFISDTPVYKCRKGEGQEEYRNTINDILRYYDEGYELSDKGEILKLPSSGFRTLIEESVETNDPNNIDLRIQKAISRYSRYSASIDDKKEAIRILADVLEYLRGSNIQLPEKDDSDLFNIINRFDIRHHNRNQRGDYTKEVWYDWMFYTFLASINALLKLMKAKL